MKKARYEQILFDLNRAGFELTHVEHEYSLFSDGCATLELNHFSGIEENKK